MVGINIYHILIVFMANDRETMDGEEVDHVAKLLAGVKSVQFLGEVSDPDVLAVVDQIKVRAGNPEGLNVKPLAANDDLRIDDLLSELINSEFNYQELLKNICVEGKLDNPRALSFFMKVFRMIAFGKRVKPPVGIIALEPLERLLEASGEWESFLGHFERLQACDAAIKEFVLAKADAEGNMDERSILLLNRAGDEFERLWGEVAFAIMGVLLLMKTLFDRLNRGQHERILLRELQGGEGKSARKFEIVK